MITRDWGLGAFVQYGSGLPLAPPAATTTNYLGALSTGGSEQFRVPGQPLFLKNLNCGCINPYYDQVLNPAAWANPANGTFGPAIGTYYGDFRSARRPQENANLGRTFRFKERYCLAAPRRVREYLQPHSDRQPHHNSPRVGSQQELRWSV